MKASNNLRFLLIFITFVLLSVSVFSISNFSVPRNSVADQGLAKNLHLKLDTFITKLGADNKLYHYSTTQECRGLECYSNKTFTKMIPRAKELLKKNIKQGYFPKTPAKKQLPLSPMGYPPQQNACYDFVEWKLFGPMDFVLNPKNNSFMTEEEKVNFALQAMGEWELYNEYIFGNLTVDYNPKPAYVGDGKNMISFSPYPSPPEDFIAITYRFSYKVDGKDYMAEADIEFNSYFYFGNYLEDANFYDFQGILTHEIGHAAALNDLYDKSCYGQTMYWADSKSDSYNERTIEAGDKYGIYLLYPMNCFSNSDCGSEEIIEPAFCKGNDVYKKAKNYACENAATPASYCAENTTDKLIEQCTGSNVCSSGQCVLPKCSTNSDCGSDAFVGEKFCNGNDVYQKYTKFICNNPGAVNASCSSSTEDKSLEQCGNSNKLCNLGECAPSLCSANSDCGLDSFIDASFCIDNSVYQKKQTFICENPATLNANCKSNLFDELLQNCAQGKKCSAGKCLIYINVEAMKAWKEYQQKQREIMMQGPYIDVNLLKGIKDYAYVPKQDNGSNQQPQQSQQSNNASNSQQGQQSTGSKMTALTVLPAITSPVNKTIQQVNYPEPKPVSKIRLRR